MTTRKMMKPGPAPEPSFLLFGIPPDRRRPVGARFTTNDVGVARWIARHSGLRVVAAETEPLVRLAGRLPEWRLRPDGSPLLTVLTTALWEELRAATPSEAEQADQLTAPTDVDKAASTARMALAEPLWAALSVGDTVLAPEFDEAGELDGWWEAVILALTDDVYTVCWLDEPETGFRKRKLTELAPLHPSR